MPATKSVEATMRKNKVIIEPKNATTWFFVWEEKNNEMAINDEAKNNSPTYPVRNSGIYTLEPAFEVRKYNENGRLTVRSNPIATNVRSAKNLERTIWVSEIRKLNNTSNVLFFFSSARDRMVRAGTKTIISHGRISKKGLKEADPTTKISFTNKKFENTANNVITI